MVLLPYFPHTHHQHCNHHLLPLTHRNRLDQPFSVLNGGESVECVILTQEKPPHIKIEFLHLALAWSSAVSMTIINSMTTGMIIDQWPSAWPSIMNGSGAAVNTDTHTLLHCSLFPSQYYELEATKRQHRQFKKNHYSTCCQINQELGAPIY